ncbi:MAG: hypothetical protein ABI724_15890 [Betaproteobacteria bacterium]
MFNARTHIPLSSALAGETALRARGSILNPGLPDMAQRTASFPIYRGVTR